MEDFIGSVGAPACNDGVIKHSQVHLCITLPTTQQPFSMPPPWGNLGAIKWTSWLEPANSVPLLRRGAMHVWLLAQPPSQS
eukprot:979390-Pelagomonas_calceolata.AAC.8